MGTLVTAGQNSVIDLLPTEVVTLSGAEGGPSGVPVALATADTPRLFEATTLTVYVVPLASPVSVHDVVATAVHVAVPGVEVTV